MYVHAVDWNLFTKRCELNGYVCSCCRLKPIHQKQCMQACNSSGVPRVCKRHFWKYYSHHDIGKCIFTGVISSVRNKCLIKIDLQKTFRKLKCGIKTKKSSLVFCNIDRYIMVFFLGYRKQCCTFTRYMIHYDTFTE